MNTPYAQWGRNDDSRLSTVTICIPWDWLTEAGGPGTREAVAEWVKEVIISGRSGSATKVIMPQ